MSTRKESEKRSDGKSSSIPKSSRLFAVASHAAMGTALGLVFALVVLRTPFFGVLSLINVSDNPQAALTTFVGTAALMFGIGAALTGLIFMYEEAEAKR